ncbi:MAG: GHMP kinase [Candidatus Aenigmarchaeota archaeon]|nr:GHMP kinase [Candidatus Aenigmarchaeota archaeon]
MIIRSRSPLRISFAGGGTDIPPYCYERGGAVISAAINKYSYATLETRQDKEIHIESVDFLKSLHFRNMAEMTYDNELDVLKAVIKHLNTSGRGANIWMRSDVPPRAGLGASAAAFAAMIGLFNHMRAERSLTNYDIAELAYRLEREELNIGGGYQDQYATVFGGINFIEFGPGGARVNPSGDIIETEKKGWKDNKILSDALDKTKELTVEIRYALMRGDFLRFGELLNEAWEAKKKHSALVADKYINDIYDIAMKNGALGGKISGAGAGGFMFFYCEPNKEHRVISALQSAGIVPVSFTFDFDGLQTWEPNNIVRGAF